MPSNASPGSGSRNGLRGPTKAPCDDRRQSGPILLPVLRRGGPAAARGSARSVALRGLPAGICSPPGRTRRAGDAMTVDLEQLARQAGRELESAPAQEIVRWAVQTFGTRLAVASSMQDAVLVHLVSQVAAGVDVLFVDTGYHFAETLGTRDAVAMVYDVNLITLKPRQTVAAQDASHGPQLHDRDPDLCCALRKVAPLDRALACYDAWATGLRRAEA